MRPPCCLGLRSPQASPSPSLIPQVSQIFSGQLVQFFPLGRPSPWPSPGAPVPSFSFAMRIATRSRSPIPRPHLASWANSWAKCGVSRKRPPGPQRMTSPRSRLQPKNNGLMISVAKKLQRGEDQPGPISIISTSSTSRRQSSLALPEKARNSKAERTCLSTSSMRPPCCLGLRSPQASPSPSLIPQVSQIFTLGLSSLAPWPSPSPSPSISGNVWIVHSGVPTLPLTSHDAMNAGCCID